MPNRKIIVRCVDCGAGIEIWQSDAGRHGGKRCPLCIADLRDKNNEQKCSKYMPTPDQIAAECRIIRAQRTLMERDDYGGDT